jgi:hypothetical protein
MNYNINELTKATKTKHLKRTNALKSSNFYMELDTLKAWSYNWWLFCTKVNGQVIFNNTMYSQTTCKHQGKAFRVLDYKADLVLRFTTASLSDLDNALTKEVIGAKSEIKNLIRLIKKPRTHKAKNLERKEQIKNLLSHISKVRTIKQGVSND